MAARSQPLALYVTSAGRERSSLAWELHEYAAKVRAGLIDDPTWLVSIFGADAEDDWTGSGGLAEVASRHRRERLGGVHSAGVQEARNRRQGSSAASVSST